MTRGKIDLTDHKLANLYRAPAERRPWKRARREKCPDEQYRQLWKLVAGAVRDTFATHPEYLTKLGAQAAERSITKRVTGTLHGYATQVARGRSMGAQDAVRDLAAVRTDSLVRERSHWTGRWTRWLSKAWLDLLSRARGGVFYGRAARNSRRSDG
jgi:hypothetical protein